MQPTYNEIFGRRDCVHNKILSKKMQALFQKAHTAASDLHSRSRDVFFFLLRSVLIRTALLTLLVSGALPLNVSSSSVAGEFCSEVVVRLWPQHAAVPEMGTCHTHIRCDTGLPYASLMMFKQRDWAGEHVQKEGRKRWCCHVEINFRVLGAVSKKIYIWN